MATYRSLRLIVTAMAIAIAMPVGLAAETTKDFAAQLGLHTFEAGVEAPDFELEYLDGERRSLHSFRGKVVFLNFWATWCPPCRAEMPSMQKLQDRYAGDDMTVLAVDLQESRAAVEKFVDEYELAFAIPLDTDGRVGALYGVHSIPTTYIIGRDGMVIAGAVGGRDWSTEEVFLFFDELVKE